MQKNTTLYLLLLVCGLARAETVNFYLPEVPGIYEQAGSDFSGRYVDMLRVVAAYAAVDFHFFIAPIARADAQLRLESNACTSRSVELKREHPSGPRYLVEVGRSTIVMLVRQNEQLGEAALAALPREQKLVFGEEPARMLRKRKTPAVLISNSLDQALAMLSAGRARVLYASRSALSAHDNSRYRIVGEVGKVAMYFSCSDNMPPELAGRLSAAWKKVLPRTVPSS